MAVDQASGIGCVADESTQYQCGNRRLSPQRRPLQEYQRGEFSGGVSRFPDKFRLVGGHIYGYLQRIFEYLTHDSNAKYVLFCVQDDVRLPTKIELYVSTLHRLKRCYGTLTPILVLSDL